MDHMFSKVVEALRTSPEKGDEEIYQILVTDGIDSHLAGQLVVVLTASVLNWPETSTERRSALEGSQ